MPLRTPHNHAARANGYVLTGHGIVERHRVTCDNLPLELADSIDLCSTKAAKLCLQLNPRSISGGVTGDGNLQCLACVPNDRSTNGSTEGQAISVGDRKSTRLNSSH